MYHRMHLHVVGQPAFELGIEVFDRPLADADDVGAGRMQGAHKLALVVGKRWLDENISFAGQSAKQGRRTARPAASQE